MRSSFIQAKFPQSLFLLTVCGGILLIVTGCGSGAATATTAPGDTGQADDQVLLDTPLSFDGALSGKLLDSQTTRASTIDPSTGQALPPEFDPDNTSVRFKDLAGNDLLDPNGLPFGAVLVGSDGSFSADNLPVGVDFIICGDVGQDGDCDIETFASIPDAEGVASLAGLEADPLTTMILAKFRGILRERGIDPRELPISPVAVVSRIVDAFIHLFEEAGIDVTIALDEIERLSPDQLAEMFDLVVPAIARVGMEIAEGNLRRFRSRDLDSIVLRAAEVFVRAGFPVADMPGPPDLGALGELDGVEAVSPQDLFPEFDPFEGPGEFADGEFEGFPGDFLDSPLDFPPPDGFDGFVGDETANQFLPEREIIYISKVAEPDRNFAGEFDESPEGDMPPLPVLNDHLLLEMAGLQKEGRRITLGDLHEMLTDIDQGLGVRLTFQLHDPNFFGPPLTVFETADGRGKAISLDKLFFRIFEEGLHDTDHESFERREAELRALLRDLLGDTVAPSYARLFGAITSERIAGIEELSERIRSARAHLPFSRSGPSAFFVVADGDQFRGDADVQAVTVDADVSADGVVSRVEHNPSGNGAYYLSFTHGTEEHGTVELLVRETGRRLHSQRGPVRLSMHDDEIFDDVDGQSFFDFVSEHGTFYPGVSVAVIREEYVPEPIFHEPEFIEPEFIEPPLPESDVEFVDITDPTVEEVESEESIVPDEGSTEENTDAVSVEPEEPEVAQFAEEPVQGPNEQLFVLATGFGEDGEPVRVDYDRATGTATYNPGGRHLLMFLPDSHETGLFGLFNEDTGRPAGERDPADFFHAPLEQPETFEDLFNEVEDFGDFANLGEFDDVLGDLIDELLLLEQAPLDPLVDGEEPVGEDELAGNDAELPPVDEEPIAPAPLDRDEPLEEFVDEPPFDEGFPEPDFILVAAQDVVGLDIFLETFTHVFGTDVPNERYDPSGDPYFDDANGNGQQDADEVTAQFRPTLFDPADWRSTDIRFYYRRADNGAPVTFEEIDWESPTPRTMDGVELVARVFLPRLNAFRFGRPNTAINLLTAFAPPEFFDGTHSLDRDTEVDIFSAIAIINLVMDQVFNVKADVDLDGIGPMPRQPTLMDAHLFVAPINDPFLLLIKGFHDRSFVRFRE